MLLTFAEMELDSTTIFTLGTNVMFIRSTEEPVLAQVVGYSEHGDAYRSISYERAATLFFRFAVQLLCLKMCVYAGSAEGGGGVTWQPSPRGWWGTVFPGWGRTGGGGVHV